MAAAGVSRPAVLTPLTVLLLLAVMGRIRSTEAWLRRAHRWAQMKIDRGAVIDAARNARFLEVPAVQQPAARVYVDDSDDVFTSMA